MRLRDYALLSFDCYGTLIDWETGIMNGLAPLIERSGLPRPRNSVLEVHARLEAAQQLQRPEMRYSNLLAVVYRRISEAWECPSPWDECLAYGESIADWPVFPDTVDSLRRLKERYKLVILSNVDNASFAKSNAKLGIEFDAIYSAEDVGCYKPSIDNFDYMLDSLAWHGFGQSEILHVAESMFHDHVPANQIGLDNCWIHRRKADKGYGATAKPETRPHFKFVFDSLAELADAVENE